MAIDKSIQTGSTSMLLLKLIEEEDMYGYQMIDTLARRSDDTFSLKAGTLYPLLKSLEQKGYLNSYEKSADSKRIRKYYSITKEGRKQLQEKREAWNTFVAAMNGVLEGGAKIVTKY